MSPTTEEIRREIEVTRSRLVDKLDHLEKRFTNPFQLTGTAMGATANSLRRSVEAITAKVQHTVRATNASIVARKQVERHPWLSLSAAAMFGYLIAGLSSKRKSNYSKAHRLATDHPMTAGSPGDNGRQEYSGPTTAALDSSKPSSDHSSLPNLEQLLWSQLASVAVRTFGKIAEESAYRAVPYLVDNLIGKQVHDERRQLDQPDEIRKEEIECGPVKLAERVFECRCRGSSD